MTRSLVVAAVALGGWALAAAGANAGPNRAATDNAVAACKAQYAGGGTTAAQLWQCSDKAELAYEKSHDPLNMDLYAVMQVTRDAQIGDVRRRQAEQVGG